MRRIFFGAFVVVLAAVASGCAVRTSGGSWRIPSISLVSPILTIVLINNTMVELEVFENGELVMAKNPASGQLHRVVVPSGNTVSRGYYNFLGRRDIVITVRGVCPPVPPTGAGCSPGQYVGTDSRSFYLYSGEYRTEYWEVNYLRTPR